MKKGFTLMADFFKGKRSLMSYRQSGFTLIEVLVVIAIIGILASVGVASYTTAQRQSRDARRFGDVRNMITELELYFTDNGRYPNNTGWVCSNPSSPATVGNPPFTVPKAPTGTSEFYCYWNNNTPIIYQIDYSLEKPNNPNAIGIPYSGNPTRYQYLGGQR